MQTTFYSYNWVHIENTVYITTLFYIEIGFSFLTFQF